LALAVVADDLRCRFASFELCAHFLDLCRLLFHSCHESFDFPLLLSVVRFQLLNFSVLFEKLIQQHRVHRFLAHIERLALLVVNSQRRIDPLSTCSATRPKHSGFSRQARSNSGRSPARVSGCFRLSYPSAQSHP